MIAASSNLGGSVDSLGGSVDNLGGSVDIYIHNVLFPMI
jgi:hypothetical protein